MCLPLNWGKWETFQHAESSAVLEIRPLWCHKELKDLLFFFFFAFLTWIIKLIKDKCRSIPVVQRTRQPGCESRTSNSVTPVRRRGMSAEAHTVDSCDSTRMYGNTWMIHNFERVCSSGLESGGAFFFQKRGCVDGYFRANTNDVSSCEWSPTQHCFTSECNKTIKRKAWQVCHGDWVV